jgi:hypothetical protein
MVFSGNIFPRMGLQFVTDCEQGDQIVGIFAHWGLLTLGSFVTLKVAKMFG